MERDLHRRLRRELRDLGAQSPLDVEELVRALSVRRGRPISLRPYALERPGPSGLWVDTADMDIVFYQQETTRLHQQQIILHEILHILVAEWEENGEEAAEEPVDGFIERWAALIPVLDQRLIRRIARRCSYTDRVECSVELAATIILEWSSVVDALPPLSDDPEVRRVQAALGDRRGWL
ncbi:hypothetical protein V1460_12925 [Streptomyces sp. SCSIO 30461]|uniref:hypothetical protein n=1 Tax=Streptomyces sp. SCSIO 30461 TaxID=3118085 RepID=UPI0030D5958F